MNVVFNYSRGQKINIWHKKIEIMNIYGVWVNGTHKDVSKTERGAKNYATRNGFSIVTIRYNCGYIAMTIAEKINGKWRPIN